MPITLDQAKNLKYRTELHHVTLRNADKSPLRVRVNGKVQTWIRKPERVKIPVKHGLRNYGYITEYDLDYFCLTAEEALGEE